MQTALWGSCVNYRTDDNVVHSVRSVDEALVALFDRWPVRTGNFRLIAMDACYAAQAGREKPEAARLASVAAAMEADALVGHRHERSADQPGDSELYGTSPVAAVSIEGSLSPLSILHVTRDDASNHSQSASILDPEDLEMLQKVFDQLCERSRFEKGSTGASRIARDLIDLFQHGIRGERQLLMMLSGAKTFP
ncbi:DUF982 domain-containing protein [Neorhizobium galegae]|uniref:DUF982 domain-containing protein n=1 Tax=Neorhizobium galegae TaxID=399 RepID=UPI00210198B8|nr:DUF982 domain-containing protein [Neorhizobium galegae]MCQ1574212.1 DUF982 domain-containing protein [Neorhizobium galegae]